DNFFGLGGDSILAIQAAGRARDAGIAFTPRQLFEHQTVAELAPVADRATQKSESEGPAGADVPLTPIQQWFLEQGFSRPNHWNQAVLLELEVTLDWPALARAAEHLVLHHDALRMRLVRDAQGWHQTVAPKELLTICHREDLSAVPEAGRPAAIEEACSRWQAGLNLNDGPIMRTVWFDLGEEQKPRLLIVIHHLAVDGVSWRILLEDLQRAYAQLVKGEAVTLPSKTTSFKRWAESLQTLARSESLQQEAAHWLATVSAGAARLPMDFPEGSLQEGDTARRRVDLSETETRALLREAPNAYRTGVDGLLLAALARTLCTWRGSDSVAIDLESHGREALFG
ncbi:MAG: condensation domain-containing protein, partial [Terriglobales bacterium]